MNRPDERQQRNRTRVISPTTTEEETNRAVMATSIPDKDSGKRKAEPVPTPPPQKTELPAEKPKESVSVPFKKLSSNEVTIPQDVSPVQMVEKKRRTSNTGR